MELKPDSRATLTKKLLQLLQTGTVGGIVLASATVDPAPAQGASLSCAESALSIVERVEQIRKQLLPEQASGETAENTAANGPKDLLTWGNWHNWRNGWPNGWHNWHNWRNW